jgi:hypothetical protein
LVDDALQVKHRRSRAHFDQCRPEPALKLSLGISIKVQGKAEHRADHVFDQVRVMFSLKIAKVIQYSGSDADLNSGCLHDAVQAPLITLRPTFGSLSCRHSSTFSVELAR